MAKVVGYFYIGAGLYINSVTGGTAGNWLIVAGQAILVGDDYRCNRGALRRAAALPRPTGGLIGGDRPPPTPRMN